LVAFVGKAIGRPKSIVFRKLPELEGGARSGEKRAELSKKIGGVLKGERSEGWTGAGGAAGAGAAGARGDRPARVIVPGRGVAATGVVTLVAFVGKGGRPKLIVFRKFPELSGGERSGEKRAALLKKIGGGLRGERSASGAGTGGEGAGAGGAGAGCVIKSESFACIDRREPLRPTVLSFLLPKLKRIVATKATTARTLIDVGTFIILVFSVW
jgi:hypothetical protein